MSLWRCNKHGALLLYITKYILLNEVVSRRPYTAVITKVCSSDRKGSVTSSQGIRGYMSVMATLKLTYFLINPYPANVENMVSY